MINFDCRLESGEIIKQEPANTLIENIMLLLKQEGLTVLAATFILFVLINKSYHKCKVKVKPLNTVGMGEQIRLRKQLDLEREVREMKTYQVSYYLADMPHTYQIDAENECVAIQKALRMPEGSAKILHDFKIEIARDNW